MVAKVEQAPRSGKEIVPMKKGGGKKRQPSEHERAEEQIALLKKHLMLSLEPTKEWHELKEEDLVIASQYEKDGTCSYKDIHVSMLWNKIIIVYKAHPPSRARLIPGRTASPKHNPVWHPSGLHARFWAP